MGARSSSAASSAPASGAASPRCCRTRWRAGAPTSRRGEGGVSAQSQHILHVVEAGRLADEPFGRAHGTTGEDLTAGRPVTELEALADGDEADRVLAGD